MEITVLGSGTSHGVPTLDCMINDYKNCPQHVCESSQTDPRHCRTRSSVLLHWDNKNVLIDVSADFRQQALREKIHSIDAVLITHSHADHIGGIPDIRSYTRKKAIPFYGSAESIKGIRNMFSYIFDPDVFAGGGVPRIDTNVVDNAFELWGKKIIPISIQHGSLKGCQGYQIGSLVYIPDMKSINDEELEKICEPEVLIVNCLHRFYENPSHMTLTESIGFARRVKPKRCYFIHMSHDIHYKNDSAKLDSWMAFSYDGMKITVPDL